MQKVLIIKPDHIGDYILFRNFLTLLKESKASNNVEITFVANVRVRDLAEYLDSDVVDYFIWIDLEKFTKSGAYRQFRSLEITQKKYDTLINFMFARFDKIEELIASIDAQEKIVIHGTKNERKPSYTQEDEKIYNKKIDLSSNKLFEYERFRYAFEALLGQKISLKPNLTLTEKHRLVFEDINYVLLFIGSDSLYRKWNRENYARLVSFLVCNYDIGVVLCGGSQEIDDGRYISEVLANRMIRDLTGETTLVDMIHLVAHSSLVISNETGIAHMSTLMQIPTLVLSNGNHYGKFTPYPKEYGFRYFSIYPFEVLDEMALKDDFYEVSRLDINLINTERVIAKVEKLLYDLQIQKKKQAVSMELKIVKNNFIDEKQKQLNYQFSYMFSSLYLNILELIKSNEKFVLYGYGSFAKTLVAIMKDSVVGVVDKGVRTEDISAPLMSFEALRSCGYDKIVITVLGREEEIENYLVETLQIEAAKIVKFKILEGRYIGC